MSRSPYPLIAMAAAGTLALSACAAFGGPFRQPPAARVTTHDRTTRWSATLAPPFAPGATTAGATAAGPTQGSAAMRLGADAYEPLTVDAQGQAAGAVTVPLLMPTEGPFFVRVSASAADLETIVACGNLAAPSR